jgi:hypothetical protein
MGDIDQMLDNARADSWSDLDSGESYTFENPRATPLERLESYVDYCFDHYSIVSDQLDRSQVQACVADWGHRRGVCKPNARMKKREFGQRVVDSKHRIKDDSHYAVFVATPLVGVPPEEDDGAGWKPTLHHELGHAIDFEKRGTSDHSDKFKSIMREFNEEPNDGGHAHGLPPRRHR